MWNGGNQQSASWMGSNTTTEPDQNPVGNLSVIPPSPQTEPYVNPSLTLAGRNTVAFPTEYASLSITDLTVETINGSTGTVETWAEYPAITNVTAVQDNSGNPQYGISGFTTVSAQNFNASGNIVVTGNGLTSGTVNAPTGRFISLSALSSVVVSNDTTGGGSLIVNGGTTLDGGYFHGTTIGSLPVSGINTVRVDVLPVGIDIVSPTYVTIDAGGAANIAAGGAVSIAGGSYIELNTATITAINTTSGNDNTVLTIGQIQPASSGSQPLRIGGSNGVTLTSGVNVQSNLFTASNLAQLQSYTITNVWDSLTLYNIGTQVTYSPTSNEFGVGNVYQCYFQNSNCPPSNLVAPNWNSTSTYVQGNLAVYSVQLYRCILTPEVNLSPNVDLTHWTLIGNGFSDIWVNISTQLYNSLYFNAPSQSHYWSLIAPIGSGYDGIYVVERETGTDNLIAMGQLYDTIINPVPFNPNVSSNLIMNGYDIVNAGDIQSTTLSPSSGTTISMLGNLDMNANTITDVNRINVDNIFPNVVETVTFGSSIGLSNYNIESVNTIDTNTISAFTNSYITSTSDLNMNGNNLTDVNIVYVDNIQSATSSEVLFNSDIFMEGHAIARASNIATDELSGGSSGTVTLMNHFDANNQDILNVANLSLTNIEGNGSGPIELQSAIAGNNNELLGMGTITTSLIEGIDGSSLYVGSTIDMNYYAITDVSGILTDSISAYSLDALLGVRSDIDMNGGNINNINGIQLDTIESNTGTNVLFHTDIDMNGNNILNVGNITASGDVVFPDGIDLLDSNISNVNQINVDYLQSNTNSAIALNSNINGQSSQILSLNEIGADNLTDGGSGFITLNANIIGNNEQINGISQLIINSVPSESFEANLVFTSDSGNTCLQINAIASTDDVSIQNPNGAITIESQTTLNLTSVEPIIVTAPTVEIFSDVDMNQHNINDINSIALVPTLEGVEPNIIFYSDLSDESLILQTASGTDDSSITNPSGNLTIQSVGNLIVSSDTQSIILNASAGAIEANTDLIMNYNNIGDVQNLIVDNILPNTSSNVTYQCDLNLNNYNISNVNQITTNTSFYQQPSSSNFFQLRIAPFTLFVNPNYWAYAPPSNPTVFTPIASEWSHFAVNQPSVNINNAYLNSVRYINQQTVRQPMIQRGTGTTASTGYVTITLPVGYTSTSYQVSITPTASVTVPFYISSMGTYAFVVTGNASKTFMWVAYGDAV